MTPKEIFAQNLNRMLNKYGKSQADIVAYMNTTASTVSDWCNGKKYPRVDKVQKLADYFGILKSDLTEEYKPVETPKDVKKERLIKNYELLNDEGKEDLLDYSDMLASNPRKLKENNQIIQGLKNA